jgi:flagellar biosynthesis protein FlhG
MTHKPAKVLSVTSGKGGVGKTHTTVNLGLALVKMGKKVLLLDADLGLANINVLLGFKPGATLHDLFAGRADLSDIIVHHPSGLDIVPAASGVQEITDLTANEQLSLLSAVDDIALNYDFMIVDTAAGIGDNVMYFNTAVEEILVVIDQEPTSITDAYAIIKVLASKYDVRQFSVVVNRTPIGKDGRETYAKLAGATDRFLQVSLKYLGSISDDEAVVEAVIQQKPFLELFPSSRASRDILRLAAKVAGDEGTRIPKGGMQFFFRALVEAS